MIIHKVFTLLLFMPLLGGKEVFSQTLSKINELNGFRDFKFGDSEAMHEHQLTLDSNYVEIYSAIKVRPYICNDPQKAAFAGLIFSYLRIHFYDNQLYYIDMTIHKREIEVLLPYGISFDDAIERIYEELKLLFGKPTKINASEHNMFGINKTLLWETEKNEVLLIIQYPDDDPSLKDPRAREIMLDPSIGILFTNKEIEAEKQFYQYNK